MLRLTLYFILIFVRYADAETAILKATRDNTLYETKDGSISNGAGSYIFAGSTRQTASEEFFCILTYHRFPRCED